MRYLSSISLALIVLMALACTATPAEPTPNIDATVEAKVGVALAKVPTVTPIPTPTPVPTTTPIPTVTPPPTPVPTATPIPLPTPIPITAVWSFDPLFNPDWTPLKNPVVKWAIHFAIDEREIDPDFYYLEPTHSRTVREYDVETAKSRMADSGYPDGFEGLCIDTKGESLNKQLAIAVAEDLTDIGVVVGIHDTPGLDFDGVIIIYQPIYDPISGSFTPLSNS